MNFQRRREELAAVCIEGLFSESRDFALGAARTAVAANVQGSIRRDLLQFYDIPVEEIDGAAEPGS